MGSHRTQELTAALILTLQLGAPATAQEAGWHYSPLPGEGDRATLGCDRNAIPGDYACLVVRCEDDFSTGIYVHSNRLSDLGPWDLTLDGDDIRAIAQPGPGPYGAKFGNDADWLLERLQQGSFVYLRHVDDEGARFRFIDLSGSLYAINRALAWCAPRVPAVPVKPTPDDQ